MNDAKTRKTYLETEILQKFMSKIGLFGPIWVFFACFFPSFFAEASPAVSSRDPWTWAPEAGGSVVFWD